MIQPKPQSFSLRIIKLINTVNRTEDNMLPCLTPQVAWKKLESCNEVVLLTRYRLWYFGVTYPLPPIKFARGTGKDNTQVPEIGNIGRDVILASWIKVVICSRHWRLHALVIFSVTINQFVVYRYDTIRYDTRCYFNVRSKADISQLSLPHGTDN